MVEEFRSRKLDKEYPVLWADALHGSRTYFSPEQKISEVCIKDQ